jgi:hypothetical protein
MEREQVLIDSQTTHHKAIDQHCSTLEGLETEKMLACLSKNDRVQPKAPHRLGQRRPPRTMSR